MFLIVLALALAPVEEKDTIQKSFAVSRPEAARIEIDNVHGVIRVTGYDGRDVQVTVRRRIEGDSPEKVEQARKEVTVDMTQQGDTVRLYVDGPFRCKCADGSVNYRGRRHYGYKVVYDFEVKAPRQASLFAHNVNDGDIHVSGIEGSYDLKNINGGIEMLDAGGSGRVYALNGDVKVTFRRNPRAESSFGSLNGQVDLFFQPDLSADLKMKTFNGEIFSDFPVSALPRTLAASERRDGKRVWKTDKFARGRVGSGGPEIELDGFNGDIRILKRQGQ
jgi:DUF4097 and DUF4098 domain-containing protein YvlB